MIIMPQNVPIQVYIKDILEPKLNWQLGVWDYTKDRKVWGLLYSDSPTVMSYDLERTPPKDHIERRKKKFEEEPDRDWLRWYFDVGRKLYVTLDDLEEACKELGIWDTNETTETVQS